MPALLKKSFNEKYPYKYGNNSKEEDGPYQFPVLLFAACVS
jgi:hypothetical protein